MTTPNFAVKEKNPKMGFLKNIVASFTEREKRCAELLTARIGGKKESVAEEKVIQMPVKQVMTPAQDDLVKAIITKDHQLLDQYYKLKRDVYAEEYGWEDFDDTERAFDENGKIVILVDQDNRVLGGARLMISNGDMPLSGDFLNTTFTYKNLFKFCNIDTANKKYSEISSFLIDPNYRGNSGVQKILEFVLRESLNNGCSYIVGWSSLARCRIYRMMFDKINCKLNIVKEFPWPEKEILQSKIQTFPMIVPIEHCSV